MNQVSQIQSIESNQQLTSTLQSVALGQSIASAGNLIGRTVTGTDSTGKSGHRHGQLGFDFQRQRGLERRQFEHRPERA